MTTPEEKDRDSAGAGAPPRTAGQPAPAASRERPILFSAPMVRALLDGRKTQTRRAFKMQPIAVHLSSEQQEDSELLGLRCDEQPDGRFIVTKPRFAVGDRLYVREAWRCNGWASDVATIMYRANEGDGYTAMAEQYPVAGKTPQRVTATWRPSIHMPRWASRITLAVTDVRVQRIQDIRHADAKAEGVLPFAPHRAPQGGSCDGDSSGFDDCARCAFKLLWAQINGGQAWFANPWVVAVTFERLPSHAVASTSTPDLNN